VILRNHSNANALLFLPASAARLVPQGRPLAASQIADLRSPVIPRSSATRDLGRPRSLALLGREHSALTSVSAPCSHFPQSGLHRSPSKVSTTSAPPALDTRSRPLGARIANEPAAHAAPGYCIIGRCCERSRRERARGFGVDHWSGAPGGGGGRSDAIARRHGDRDGGNVRGDRKRRHVPLGKSGGTGAVPARLRGAVRKRRRDRREWIRPRAPGRFLRPRPRGFDRPGGDPTARERSRKAPGEGDRRDRFRQCGPGYALRGWALGSEEPPTPARIR
jgi:hypothetical protein